MNYSKKYDQLIKQSVGKNHLLDNCPYYDEIYYIKLKKEIEKWNLLDSFKLELNKDSKGKVKMCSVASSSRLGFLYGIQNKVLGFERTNVKNGICRPHYDNFDEKTNTFFEYKCHEFCSERLSHNYFLRNPQGYKDLLLKHFGVEYDLDKKDLFGTFDLQPCMFFDIKQLLCHLLGLLSIADKQNTVSLQYLMFIPKRSILQKNDKLEIDTWLEHLEKDINYIFEQMSKKHVETCNGETGKLSDFIKLSFKYQDVSEIDDFVYMSL